MFFHKIRITNLGNKIIRIAVLLIILGSLMTLKYGNDSSRYAVVTVTGTSMQPATFSGDRWIVDKKINPVANDIIVFRDFDNNILIKRVFIAPGMKYWFSVDPIYGYGTDGFILYEYYLNIDVNLLPKHTKLFNGTLGEDEYVVMGDNQSVSNDSRFFGPIHRDQIIGVLVRKL